MAANYCPNCGAQIQDGKKFCLSCGIPINSAATVNQQSANDSGYVYAPKFKKKGGKTALIVLACIAGFIALAYIAATIALGGAANADYYKLGNDRVASVKQAVGKRPISKTETSTSGGVTTMTLVYTKLDDARQDLTDYAAYLRNECGFSVTGSYNFNAVPGTAQLAVKSVDEGQIIILDIAYDADYFTLVFTKGKGTLDFD